MFANKGGISMIKELERFYMLSIEDEELDEEGDDDTDDGDDDDDDDWGDEDE